MTTLIIPDSIDQSRGMLDFPPYDDCIYIPVPDGVNEGFYVNRTGIVALLRANKDNPDAIQYIADMLE